MATYKVGYVNENGERKAFRFDTDKSFRSYGRSISQGVLGLGNPFVEAMMAAAKEHGVAAVLKSYTSIKMIKNIYTGEVKHFI